MTKRKPISPFDHEPPYSTEEMIELSKIARIDVAGDTLDADSARVVKGRVLDALLRLLAHYNWLDEHRWTWLDENDKTP